MGGCCCLSLARDPRPCPGLSWSGAWAQAAPRRSDRTYREAENTASKCHQHPDLDCFATL